MCGRVFSKTKAESVFAEWQIVYQQAILGRAITSPAAQPRFLSHASHQELSAPSKLQGVDETPSRQAAQFMQDLANFAISNLPQPDYTIACSRSLSTQARGSTS